MELMDDVRISPVLHLWEHIYLMVMEKFIEEIYESIKDF